MTEATDRYVELGEHRFTQEQWETISAYAWGYAATKEREHSRMQDGVTMFQEAMGLPVHRTARPLDPERHDLRVELIREEFEELKEALAAGDMVEQADACVDIIYVTLGLLVEMGINVAPLFEEVQASNMSKFDEDGNPIIAGPNDPDGVFEGRVKKGPDYFRPNLAGLIASGAADLEKAGLIED